ncbi:acyl-CoA thioesterase [bacterium]|nr:acyl-CoA thioesterase [bacterium]
MELITTKVCMAKDIGVHGNLFGGNMMAFVDESAAAYVCQICNTPRMVTVKVSEFEFKRPVKVGNILKFYGEVIRFGTTSITVSIVVKKYSVYTQDEEVVTSTNMTFVRIDDEGSPIPISERVKNIYFQNHKDI